ncbi:ribonucleases P/MRP protein subunit POP1 [Silene latifolia]|uniref:ribonucleases P/MRP protein subunit POP1 n=1 Tax=Silene latifolia TaxID=37657 RepID=UPI003D7899D5
MAASTTTRQTPSTGNVNAFKYAESRAAELESLQSIISNRLNDDFRTRRNKRRRTTSFATKTGRRNKQKTSRRVRRRVELQNNPEHGFVVSGDGTKRLRTHVWHAKRFSIQKMWGFYLPLGVHGPGRGSRSLLNCYRQGALIHDASFYTVILLKASQEALLSLLTQLLMPSPSHCSEHLSQRILCGESFGTAMLLHVGQNKPICPVTYLWRPFHQQGTDEETESSSNLRHIWMWMHPSVSAQGLDCIKLVCQNTMNETGVMVDCVSLDGQLGRIDVMGEGAFQILQKILHPLTLSEKSLKLKNLSMKEHTNGCEPTQNNILEKEESFSSHAVLSLNVVDPRFLSTKVVAAVPDAQLAGDLLDLSEDTNKDSHAGSHHEKEDVPFTLQSQNECNSSDLWDSIEKVQPPMEEHLLCQERHKKSLDFFCLKDTSSVKSSRTQENFSTSCPILLMRRSYRSGLLKGWSIVLPISWVKAFWIPFVTRGAHAIGLREKHWISCDVGLPYFPSDFPDCPAYSSFMANKAEAVEQTMDCRSPAMKPFKVPMLLPWNSRCFTINDGISQSSAVTLSCNRGVNVDQSHDVPPNDLCEISVARTCKELTSFLHEISGDHLLLFPKGLNADSFSSLMISETNISQASGTVPLASQGNRLCYLRVLLRAFREGVFDEGAVICAPHFSDISLWTRSENGEGLHVPDAFVSSYFKEQSPGKWEFQMPEDAAAREAYRRPIGFVTTGFVRGSKRPSAIGLCEAVLLAQLRLDQWSQTYPKKRRKEVFVLVRNLRSTAYRLALATILLEEQEDDVESF